MIEADLVTHLKSVGGVAVRPGFLPPDDALPAITYLKVSGVRHHSHDGASGLASPRFQINCWAATYLAAKQLAETVRLGSDGYKEGDIQGMFLQDEADIPDPSPGNEPRKRFGVRFDLMIWNEEPKPSL